MEKLLRDIYEEKNDWIGQPKDIVLETALESLSLETRKPAATSTAAVSKNSLISQQLLKDLDSEMVQLIVTGVYKQQENDVNNQFEVYQSLQNEWFLESSRFDRLQQDNVIDYVFDCNNEIKQTVPKSDNPTQRNNVQVLAPEQPKSQLEESIRKGMFQFKDIEPPEMIQFKHLLKQLVMEMNEYPRKSIKKLAARIGNMYNPLSGSKVGPRLLNTILNVNNLSVREQKLVQEIARMITEKNVDLDVNLMNQELDILGLFKAKL